MSIQQLNQGTLTQASQIAFGDPTNGCDRRASVNALASVIASLLPSSPGGLITQYFAPNATGWSVLVAPPENGESTFLLITPAAGYAAGTVTLPAVATCLDGQELLVSCTQVTTTFTVAGNGATVNGAPVTLVANGFFRLRFDGVFKAWYRVG